MIFTARPSPVGAHQPFFEEDDLTASSPWFVEDADISTAVYATLATREDVDYFTFEGRDGQDVLLEMTIPRIEGQQDFAPMMALIGPGLSAAELPDRVVVMEGDGVLLVPPPEGEPTVFDEPFSGTSYWERQETRVVLPETATYVVAVWHSLGRVGRYTFVIGDVERIGGQLIGLGRRLEAYWTPVPEPEAPVSAEAASTAAPDTREPAAPISAVATLEDPVPDGVPACVRHFLALQYGFKE
jgi:hypothetical protein